MEGTVSDIRGYPLYCFIKEARSPAVAAPIKAAAAAASRQAPRYTEAFLRRKTRRPPPARSSGASGSRDRPSAPK